MTDEQRAQELIEQLGKAIGQYATDAALRAILLPYVRDSARLEYVYSGTRTTSNALVEIEIRMLSGDIPTLDEVRAAIDRARSEG